MTKIRRAFATGNERSLDQDVEFGIVQIVDIAVKALSPSVNDPTTARTCIDRLGELLIALGNRAMPAVTRTDGDGSIIFIARRITFAHTVHLACGQIRHFGRSMPSVISHQISMLGKVAALIPPERRAPVVEQAHFSFEAAMRTIESSPDRAMIRDAAAWIDRLEAGERHGGLEEKVA